MLLRLGALLGLRRFHVASCFELERIVLEALEHDRGAVELLVFPPPNVAAP
jgi:hypothetical protein